MLPEAGAAAGGKTPATIASDVLHSYKKAAKREVPGAAHVDEIHSTDGRGNNNIVGRLNK